MTDSPRQIIYAAREFDRLSQDGFRATTSGLAPRPEGDTPFCLSLMAYFSDDTFILEPGCQAWTQEFGKPRKHDLGHQSPELTQAWAINALTLFGDMDINEHAELLIRSVADRSKSRSYFIAACTAGLFVLAHDYRSLWSGGAQDEGFAAALAPAESCHERLAQLEGLGLCARALVQHQAYGSSHLPDYSFLITEHRSA